MPSAPRTGRPTLRRFRSAVAVIAAVTTVGLVVQACGVTSMGGGMGSMSGGMMGDGMMGSDQRYADASAAPPMATAPEVRVVAGDMYFEPAEIRMDAGATVNLTIDNEGAAFHDLTIPALDFLLAADGGSQATGPLTVVEPGNYEFFCSVPGHAQAGMTGTLLVE